MTDQQLALQAVSEAQRILEEYLEPRPHNHERILDRLVEVLERLFDLPIFRERRWLQSVAIPIVGRFV